MRRSTVTATAALGAVLVTAAMIPAGAAAQAKPVPGWRKAPMSKITVPTRLAGVVAFSSRDAWAVGQRPNEGTGLILRWNGKKWAPARMPGSGFSRVSAVAGTSGSDVWVTGERDEIGPSAAHWDGKKWRVMTLPAPRFTAVNSITAISRKDVWVAGGRADTNSAYFAHWNGKKWTRFRTPAPPSKQYHELYSIAAAGPKDVWAVGGVFTASSTNSLIYRWNGKKWAMVKAPKPTPNTYTLNSVTVLPNRQVWAAGRSAGSGVVLRYNRGKWEHAPKIPSGYFMAGGLTSDGANGLWATLTAPETPTGPTATVRTSYAHWTGKKWTLTPGASYAGTYAEGADLALVPKTRSLWAVGYYSDRANAHHGHIEVYGPLPR